MPCPHCEAMKTTKRRSRTEPGYLRFRCRSCHRKLNERTGTRSNHLQYPTDIVSLVVLWRVHSFLRPCFQQNEVLSLARRRLRYRMGVRVLLTSSAATLSDPTAYRVVYWASFDTTVLRCRTACRVFMGPSPAASIKIPEARRPDCVLHPWLNRAT